MSESLTSRDIPSELWQIVLWAQKPVWYHEHVVYPDEGEIVGISVCTQDEWKARGDDHLLMPAWDNGSFIWATAE